MKSLTCNIESFLLTLLPYCTVESNPSEDSAGIFVLDSFHETEPYIIDLRANKNDKKLCDIEVMFFIDMPGKAEREQYSKEITIDVKKIDNFLREAYAKMEDTMNSHREGCPTKKELSSYKHEILNLLAGKPSQRFEIWLDSLQQSRQLKLTNKEHSQDATLLVDKDSLVHSSLAGYTRLYYDEFKVDHGGNDVLQTEFVIVIPNLDLHKYPLIHCSVSMPGNEEQFMKELINGLKTHSKIMENMGLNAMLSVQETPTIRKPKI